MRFLATARADGIRSLGETVLAERGALGEGVVLISRTRDEELPACVRKLREAGLSVIVVALATHTYRTPPMPGSAARAARRSSSGASAGWRRRGLRSASSAIPRGSQGSRAPGGRGPA